MQSGIIMKFHNLINSICGAVFLLLMSCASSSPQKIPLSSFNNASITYKNRYTVSYEKNGVHDKFSEKGKNISINQNGDLVSEGTVIPRGQINQIIEKQKNGSHWAWGVLAGATARIAQTVIQEANAGYCDGCPTGFQVVVFVPVYSLVGAGLGALIPKYKESKVFK